MTECIFCKIVNKELPSHKVWEDSAHLAFLTIFPNTEGATVVIPKKHYSSYAFDNSDQVLTALILAAKTVAKMLDSQFSDVGRTALVLEGFGVDHLHAKLFPMHGTKQKEWQAIHSDVRMYFEQYPGYISSHDGERADDARLAALAKRLRR